MDDVEGLLLRRIILQSIPNTCFQDIEIDDNKSVLSNCHIKSRIQNLPVPFPAFSNEQKFQDFIDENEELVVNHAGDEDDGCYLDIMCECSKSYDAKNEVVKQYVTTEDFTFYKNDHEAKTGTKIIIPNPYISSRDIFKVVDLHPVVVTTKPCHDEVTSTESLAFRAKIKIGVPYISSTYSICETPVILPSPGDVQTMELVPRIDLDTNLIIAFAKRIYTKKMRYYINLYSNREFVKNGTLVFKNDMFSMPVYITKKLNSRSDVSFASCDLHNFHKKDGVVNYIMKSEIHNNNNHISEILQEILNESNLLTTCD